MSQSLPSRSYDPRGTLFALAVMAATIWYAVGAWQDIGRRNFFTWAEPAKIESPRCTTYNLMVTWCSAQVESGSGMQTVTTLHFLPPGFYDWFSRESKLASGDRTMVFGLRDRQDPSHVTTTVALDYAGARLLSSLVMFVIAAMLLLASFATPMQKPAENAGAAVPSRKPVVDRAGSPKVLFGKK